MDPKETSRSAATTSGPESQQTRDDARRPRDPAETGETYDESSMTEGMSAASSAPKSSSSTYQRTPSVSTERGTARGGAGQDSAMQGSAMQGGAAGSGTADDERIVGGTQRYWDDEGPGPRIMAADTLEGDKVVNAAGEDLGEIQEIMIDVPSGRVAYAVLSFGGFLGVGDKLFAIPWQALKLDPENHRFILDIDKERLRAAPGFDKDHWPSMADQRWAVEVHEYYSSRPYWE